MLPEHSEALKRAAEPPDAKKPKLREEEATRLENTRTAQPDPSMNMGGISFKNKRAHVRRPDPAEKASKAEPAKEVSKPVRTVSDFRRADALAPAQKREADSKSRPTDKLVDQYRRVRPTIGRTR